MVLENLGDFGVAVFRVLLVQSIVAIGFPAFASG